MRDQGTIPSFSSSGQPSRIRAERWAVDEVFNHRKFIVLEPLFGEKLLEG
jgi:hypothetical protein